MTEPIDLEQNHSKKSTFNCLTLQQTEAAGREIALDLTFPSCVYLHGEIGAGKTSLCQSIIANLGCSEPVTSPTYNIIQEYSVDAGTVYHMDLYRIEDASEIEFLGLDDLWGQSSLFLVEWPENGVGWLRDHDRVISINKIFRGEQVFREIILL